MSIVSLLFLAGIALQAQVIDTTKRINTWKLMHNYTRFEESPLDTNMHQVHREYNPAFREGFAYEYLGILGHASNHVDYFLRPGNDKFVFGNGFNPYLLTPDRTLFFNTRTPFTSLAYSTIPVVDWREENIDALHTQNITPYTNFGLLFNILAGKPLYTNEDTRVNRVGLFGSHAKDRYSIFGTLYYNDFKVQDHGGLQDMESFIQDAEDKPWLYPMILTDAKSQYRNFSVFATQKYNLFERSSSTDSLGVTTTSGKTLSLSHQLLVERQLKSYYDEVDSTSIRDFYFGKYYYDLVENTSPFDSAREDKISNVIQVILGDPDYDKISARVYAGHEWRRFGMLSPTTFPAFSHLDTLVTDPLELDSIFRDSTGSDFLAESFNDVFVGFHLAGPTTGTWDWVIDGRYYPLGYYQNDFMVNATFSRTIMQKADLGLRGAMELRRPHYFSNKYSSAFFQWDNDFPATYKLRGEAFVRSEEMEMDLRAGIELISNYQYWDTEAMPRVYEPELMVLSGSFSKHFRLGGFNSEDKLLLQYTTAADVLRLPLAGIYSSNYWRQPLFKGALITTLGFDLYYTTKYKASAYMPATGVFYLQNDYDVGGYPFLDVFLAIKIAKTRIFVSWNNLLNGGRFLGNNYFTTYNYPMKPRNIRAGLVWIFYD